MATPRSVSILQVVNKVIADYRIEHDGERPAILRMNVSNYLRMGAAIGWLPKIYDDVRVEPYLSDAEKQEVLRVQS